MSKPPAIWMNTLGRGARVLVVDTGFSPALAPMTFPQDVRLFTLPDERWEEHGSLVARTIASQDPQQLGVAPACELYIARAVERRRQWEPLRRALQWAIDVQADVVNMSLAFAQEDAELFELVDQLDRSGTIVVASWSAELAWPHRLPSVVSVSGDVVRPGADLAAASESYPPLITVKGRVFRGTSVAAAHVAGVAACAKAQEPRLNRAGFLDVIASVRPSTSQTAHEGAA